MYQFCQINTKNAVNTGFFHCVLQKYCYKIYCKNILRSNLMNTTDLVDAIAKETGMTKVDSKNVLYGIFDIISQTLKSGDEVRVSGFGTFVGKKQEARQGRNPQTGAAIQIPASVQAKFRPAKELKDTLNQK
jgi:DNA-binding protein HU-beta